MTAYALQQIACSSELKHGMHLSFNFLRYPLLDDVFIAALQLSLELLRCELHLRWVNGHLKVSEVAVMDVFYCRQDFHERGHA